MILRISKSIKRIIAVLSQHRNPNQMAWGFSMGIVLGLVPKDNLIAVAMILGMLAFRINHLIAVSVAVSVSLIGPWFEPVTHSVGLAILNQSMVAAAITKLYQFPIVPWTSLENTLVSGGLLLGIASLFPAFVVSRWLFSRVRTELESRAIDEIAKDANSYRKSVIDQTLVRQEKPAPTLRISNDSKVASPSALDFKPTKVPLDPKVVTIAKSEQEFNGQAFHREASNGNMTSRNWMTKNPKQLLSKDSTHSVSTITDPVGKDTILRETVIEVVRFKFPSSIERRAPQSLDEKEQVLTPLSSGKTMVVAGMSTNNSAETKAVSKQSTAKLPIDGSTLSIEVGHSNIQPTNREESLRYLLWHINGTRETSRKSSEKSA